MRLWRLPRPDRGPPSSIPLIDSIPGGSARVVSTSTKILCTAMLVDFANVTPISLAQLTIVAKTKQKGGELTSARVWVRAAAAGRRDPRTGSPQRMNSRTNLLSAGAGPPPVPPPLPKQSTSAKKSEPSANHSPTWHATLFPGP